MMKIEKKEGFDYRWIPEENETEWMLDVVLNATLSPITTIWDGIKYVLIQRPSHINIFNLRNGGNNE